ncbi:MAG: type II secretion system F family protein [Candidatus Bathyarchaeota archaeon]|nr:type II secretion system F family protein [Candidatus Bathyarchaeota archaeon]
MPRIEKWEKKIAWIASSILGGAIIITACITLWDRPLFDEYILLAMVVTIFPPAVLDYIDYRWRRSIDEHLPDLFRSIVQAQQTGITLPQALEEASKRSYGPLTKELKKVVANMSWGMSFEQAFESLGRRVDTVLMRRTVPLVVEASRSGGRIEKVFDPIGKFIQSTLMLNKECRAQTRPYVAIVYVAFYVFLFTVVLLFKSLFFQVAELPISGSVLLTPETTLRMFFHMSAIQAFFGGLTAGKMGEESVSAGLKHCVILLASGYLVFKLIL